MRPHKLIMKAFISYVDATVDFDALGNTVYAIVGNTGSGKTAIFDGLMFALYGVCSGEGRTGADYPQIHCDLCKHEDGTKEPMEVVLEFSSCDKRYKVTRMIKWGSTNKAAKMDFSSDLSVFDDETKKYKSYETSSYKFDSDNINSNTNNKVTVKIKEIVGLDANQFKNIVMIAQGEFAHFLNSDADDRKAILGKVYKNQQHADLQARIHQAVSRLDNREKEQSTIARQKLSEITVPDYCELSEEETNKLNIDHPDLLSVIDAVISKMSGRRDHLESETKALDEIIKKKEHAITAAKGTNSLFDSLKSQQEDLNSLDNDKTNIDGLRCRLKNVDAASKVLPYEQASYVVGTALSEASEKQKILGKELVQKSLEHEKLETASTKIAEENKADIEKLSEEASSITAILPFYEALENSNQALNSALNDYENKREQADKLFKELGSKKTRNEDYLVILKGLENAGDPAVASAYRELGLVQEKKKDLDDFDKSVKDYLKLEKDMIAAQQKWNDDAEAATKAGDEYKRINSLFIDGQAIVLADDMRSRLETETEVRCPVCGAKHTKDDILSFAHAEKEGEKVPSRDEVNEALKRRNELEEKANKSYDSYQQINVQCEGSKSAIKSRSGKLIGTEQWDEIISGDLFDKCKAECSDAEEKAEAAYTKASDERKLKIATSNLQHELEIEIGEKEAELKEAEKLKTEAESFVEVCKAQVSEQKKPLSGFPETKAEAEKKKTAAEQKVKALQAEIESAAKKEQEAGRMISELQGSIISTKAEIESLTTKAEEAESLYKENLTKNGFAEEKAYKAVLIQDGLELTVDNIDTWIEDKRKEVNDFDSKAKELTAGIAVLKKQTEGKVKVDVAALSNEIEDLKGQLDPMQREFEQNKYDLKRYNGIKEDLADIQGKRRKYGLARECLEKMDEVANSKTGEKFDSYILRDFFKSVLVSANERLEVMTRDRFSLEYDDDEKKGLGIKVLDNTTNTCRKTGNFSGGQSFEASLALALGVADTVQNEENRAIQIDSLFIDEGFGTQDSTTLELVMKELTKLSGDKRQVGIISHVEEFEETEIKKVRVVEGSRGSNIMLDI